MPLTATEHGYRVVEPFLWGLLPDNDEVLRRWGQRFSVSPRNVFNLLAHVGEECAGAVQLVAPERTTLWLRGQEMGTVEWLEEAEVAERMRLLLADHSAARTGRDAGQFSLAGAQPKTGFLFDPENERWGVPSGMIPTTHIFKPATGHFDGYAENEHFCISLARELGIQAAPSRVRYFGDVAVIIVERYDRLRRPDGTVRRIHQEDLCQALACPPHLKYESEGGPSAGAIMKLVRERSSNRREDETAFVDALVFNWLIGGTDAHAKNFSCLLAGGGQVRLAPLYDLSSVLPYGQQVPLRKAKLAMRIGDQYQLLRIGAREWRKLAEGLRVDYEAIRERILGWSAALPDLARAVERQMAAAGIGNEVTARLAAACAGRAVRCGEAIVEGNA